MKLIIVFLLTGTTLVQGGNTGLLYGENGEMQVLSSLVRTYIQDHNGETPRSWEDLEMDGQQDISGLRRDYLKSRGSRLEDKFVFVDGEFDVPRTGKATLVLIRTSPIGIDNAPTQRMFVLVVDGKIGNFAVSEQEAEKMFADAGKELPGKGNKPDRESMVDGKAQYVAADATPTPTVDQSLQTKSTPFQGLHASTPAASPDVQPTPTIVEKSSSGMLILAIVALAGLLAGALVFFLWKK